MGRVVLIIFAVLIAMAILGSLLPPAPSEPDRAVTVSTPCGMEQLDAYHAYEAITRGDLAALGGLSERGKIITLESGVQVHSVMVRGNLSNVRAASGRHVGEYCWIATSMLR